MKLTEYNKKRDFTKTDEPKGKIKTSAKELHFVIQKHQASRLHYDFRLEIEGVLASWAVPKGPSTDTSVKRLAMQVEDHPLDYMNFEGIIPKGEYGGGTVMVWDTGTFLAEGYDTVAESKKVIKKQLTEGNIKIVMYGKKMKGTWHLVRMKGKEKEWLLLKGKDSFANKKRAFNENSVLTGRNLTRIEKDANAVWSSHKVEKKTAPKKQRSTVTSPSVFTAEELSAAKRIKFFPAKWRPQLATLTDEVFDNDEWLFEDKYDGYRALLQINKGKVNLVSRNGLSFNEKYPAIAEALSIIQEDVILDGEIVVEDKKGNSHFQWLQYYHENPDQGSLKCYVFDILYFNGFDLTSLQNIQRKKILEAVLPESATIVYSKHISGKGKQALKKADKKGIEGIIAKRKEAPYLTNKRSKDWLKIKINKEQEMVIGGYTEPTGKRIGFGAILVGYYEGKEFRYAGKVGTGFNDEKLQEFFATFKKLERKTNPFNTTPLEKNVHWLKPELVAQIKYSEWTENGSLRHPVFIALRTDKKPTAVKREVSMITEKIVDDQPVKNKSHATAPKSTAASKKTVKKTGDANDKVNITNPDKLYWPQEKITKGDVINYYNEMADYVMPYVIDRPQSLRRNPDGIKNTGFFQKNVAGQVPDWIKTQKIKSKSTEESIEYMLCQNKDTLLFMANWGCIEINPWSSRVGTINHPDYIIFDLDPNEASLKNLITTAKKVKEILDQLGINAYLKTSGGKGLHIYIPVKPVYTYTQTRNFSQTISEAVHAALPDITSLERSPDKRKGKIYLDYLQNGKGKTMASPYSLRPRESATVSTPLNWKELNARLDPKKFTIKTIPIRVKKKGDLWKNFFNDAIDLNEVLKKIK
ncbi:DNA ligase D [Gynurincola endophyticus]|uniref:DNA ligase D n=1 Tax=Gynurincola endophyticus TaxID=2479004 RepID=UPI000F8CBC63|nr:DNA ligase D [Gynurincola endophyticus]